MNNHNDFSAENGLQPLEHEIEKHGGFTSKLGFVLAAAGSAVGLGNLWRFPYLAAQYGGGIFVLCYVLLAIFFGFTLLMLEIAIGRYTGKSVIGAFKNLNKKFKSVFGYSIQQELIKIRLHYAKQMLLAGNYLVADVAKLTGWRNAFYFSYVYRKHYGYPPSATIMTNGETI